MKWQLPRAFRRRRQHRLKIGRRLKVLLADLLGREEPPERVAAAIALGIGVGFSPFMGVHFLLAIGLAFLFRLNRIDALLGQFAGNPWTLPPVFAAGYALGRLLLRYDRGKVPDLPWDRLLHRDFWHAFTGPALRPRLAVFHRRDDRSLDSHRPRGIPPGAGGAPDLPPPPSAGGRARGAAAGARLRGIAGGAATPGRRGWTRRELRKRRLERPESPAVGGIFRGDDAQPVEIRGGPGPSKDLLGREAFRESAAGVPAGLGEEPERRDLVRPAAEDFPSLRPGFANPPAADEPLREAQAERGRPARDSNRAAPVGLGGRPTEPRADLGKPERERRRTGDSSGGRASRRAPLRPGCRAARGRSPGGRSRSRRRVRPPATSRRSARPRRGDRAAVRPCPFRPRRRSTSGRSASRGCTAPRRVPGAPAGATSTPGCSGLSRSPETSAPTPRRASRRLFQTRLRMTVLAANARATARRIAARNRETPGPFERARIAAASASAKPAEGRYARRSAKIVPVGKKTFAAGKKAMRKKRTPKATSRQSRSRRRGCDDDRDEKSERRETESVEPVADRDRPRRLVGREAQRKEKSARGAEEDRRRVGGADEGSERRERILQLEDAEARGLEESPEDPPPVDEVEREDDRGAGVQGYPDPKSTSDAAGRAPLFQAPEGEKSERGRHRGALLRQQSEGVRAERGREKPGASRRRGAGIRSPRGGTRRRTRPPASPRDPTRLVTASTCTG